MANLPQNDQYAGSQGPSLSKGFKYTPSTTYQNLAAIKASGTSPFAASAPAAPGTPEYEQAKNAGISQYGKLINNGQGVPTETSFLPVEGDPNTPIPIPTDYGSFMPPATIQNQDGENFSWGTPTSPVIRNVPGDVPGQYVQDTANPKLLVKTMRGSNSIADNAIRDGRPGFMYQIDHIMPLELGGADTLANRELLTSDQNDKKTLAQAIPYTLYVHGDISLADARGMAMRWKDRDVTDIPQPNGLGLVGDAGGKTGIEIAREVAKKWSQPQAVGFKDVMAGIPQAMKDLGKGFLPDPVREFIKGFGSGATLGFLPYQQGEDESKIAGLSGKVGDIAGSLGSFLLGGEIVDGALALGGMAKGAISAFRGVAGAEAAAAGFEGAAEAANVAKTTETTFKSLNAAPGYIKQLITPQAIQQAAKFGVTNVLVGQGREFIANHMNPDTLSGQAPEQNEQGMIGNIFKDLSIGALSGIGSPTLKGTAYAVMLPTVLSYWANPDDPMGALTNGVIFGALHATGAMKNPDFNDVEALGGKKYQSPVLKSFENAANQAAYSSLSHYAPDLYPTIKQGEAIPTEAHVEANVQAAKDAAIKNIWQRFFFGKDATPTLQNKTLEDFKGFSEGLNKKIDTETPTVSGLKKFSLSARLEASKANKAQDANIRSTFGKGATSTMEGDTSQIPADGMDLNTALTEIKRVTVAARQLYKGGLAEALRGKADLDDLLSYGKGQLQDRFGAQEKYSNPPIAKQAVDSIDDSFMTNSFNNNNGEPVSGDYPTGDVALTGAALKLNKANADYFFKQKAAGNASPNILLVDRSDTAPLWRMKNQLLDPKDVVLKKYSADPNPENALQAFGVVKDPQTGQKSLVPLGWVASNFRLNEATGEGHTAFNQHEAVQKYRDTNGAEGLRPIDLHKDQIAPAMKKEGISVLVANLDPRATQATISTGNEFVPVNLNDKNWEYSKKLGDRLSQQENNNPVSMDIAKVTNSLRAKDTTKAIADMQSKIDRPASAYIPTKEGADPLTVDRVSVPRETTRGLLQGIESSLDVANPKQLKSAFLRNFGIMLPEDQATEIFNKRNEMTMRDGVKMLADAVNSGNADLATKLKMNFAKTYLESGALQSTEGGKAVQDMLVLGKMKNTSTSPTGIMPTGYVPAPETPAESVPSAPVPDSASESPALTQPEQTPDLTQESSTRLPDNTQPEQASHLSNLIVSTAQKEMPGLHSLSVVEEPDHNALPAHQDPAALAQEFIPMGKDAMDNLKTKANKHGNKDNTQYRWQDEDLTPTGAPLSDQEASQNLVNQFAKAHQGVMSDMDKTIQASLQKNNFPQDLIDEVKTQVRQELQKHSSLIAGEEPGEFTQYRKPPIPKPTVHSSDFFNFINKGMENKEQPPAHYFAKTFDTVFKSLYGANYKGKIELAKVLSTMTKEGSGFWNDIFANDLNSSGREIKQNKDIINARATGDREAEKAAYAERRRQLSENPTGGENTLTDNEKAHLGVNPEELSSGMKVTPWYQEDNMVGDLTQGDNLMAGVTSDLPMSGSSAVRDVKRIFIGAGKDSPGLLKYINKIRQEAGQRPLSIRPDIFDKLEKEASVRDAQDAIRKEKLKSQASEAKEQIPVLKRHLENITKAMEDNDPENPRPAWQTPQLLEENLQDILDKLHKYSKIMEETS